MAKSLSLVLSTCLGFLEASRVSSADGAPFIGSQMLQVKAVDQSSLLTDAPWSTEGKSLAEVDHVEWLCRAGDKDNAVEGHQSNQSADFVLDDVRNQQELDDACMQAGGNVLVAFMATWCGPCKAIAPYITQQSQEKGVPLVYVDVDQAGELAARYQIQAMPTLKVLDRSASVTFEKVGGGQGNVNACLDHILNAGLLQQSAEQGHQSNQSADFVLDNVRNQQELDDACMQAGGNVLIAFMASWCGPCKAIAPYITQQSQEKGVPLVYVDVDQAGELAARYKIQAMPTLKVLDRSASVTFEKVGGGQGNVNACLDHILNVG